MRRNRQRGSATIEFVLTGVPFLFVWIGIFWMAFGMWRFHTLQYASKMAAAYTATHGSLYVNSAKSPIQIKDVATVLAANAPGIPADTVTVTLTASSQSTSCRLDNCKLSTLAWPPTSANTVGTDITVKADYTFRSPFGMWTPSQGPVAFANAYSLAGYSHQQVLF